MRARDDSGSILPLVPIVMIALFLLGGLVVDGSRALNLRGVAQGYAEEAARSGASAIVPTSSYLDLDEALAQQRVQDYCTAITGKNASVEVLTCGLASPPFSDAPTCNGVNARIVVNTVVRLRIGTTLLGMTGATSLTGSGHAKARAYEGTSAGTAC